MADIELKSFPFDSMKILNEESGQMEEDREYEAKVFRDYFAKFLSNGVYFGKYKNYGENSMKVMLDTGLTVKVSKGCGLIQGADFENETDKLIVLERPATGERIDRIVVQMNALLDSRMTKIIVKQGNGTTPSELIRTNNIYEICLAEVTVKSTTNLTEEDIVDKRLDTELCGIVDSLIAVDGEELYQRFVNYIDSVTDNLVRKDQDSTIQGKITADNIIATENVVASGKVMSSIGFEKSNGVSTVYKDDFAIIEQETGNNPVYSYSLSYPAGFSQNNCVVLSVMKLSGVKVGSEWSFVESWTNADREQDHIIVDGKKVTTIEHTQMPAMVGLNKTGITLERTDTHSKYRIILMKI